jgi:hypothetical protein
MRLENYGAFFLFPVFAPEADNTLSQKKIYQKNIKRRFFCNLISFDFNIYLERKIMIYV